MKITSFINSNHLNFDEIRGRYLSTQKPRYVILDDFFINKYLEIVDKGLQEKSRFSLQRHINHKHYVTDDEWHENKGTQFVQRKEWIYPRSLKNISAECLQLNFLLEFLDSRPFKLYLSNITGIELDLRPGKAKPKLFSLKSNDFVKPHSDCTKGRALCMNIYLAKNWQKSCGGEICFKGVDESNPIEVSPIYNRCLLFDPCSEGSLHWVQEIRENVEMLERINITHWYFLPEKSNSE